MDGSDIYRIGRLGLAKHIDDPIITGVRDKPHRDPLATNSLYGGTPLVKLMEALDKYISYQPPT